MAHSTANSSGAGKLVLVWRGTIGGTVRCEPNISTSEHRLFGVVQLQVSIHVRFVIRRIPIVFAADSIVCAFITLAVYEI